ncbi:MAG: sirohydrochlorin cobaltochelatase [Desulfobacteraceae bacterium]|nr:sirohydrochlorin cobaltochelatase [Desulfobacteraceae bacterium]
MRKPLWIVMVMITSIIFPLSASLAMGKHSGEPAQEKTAIILASFGTTEPAAVKAITNIQNHIKQAFPGIPVKLTFTSNIIRDIWKERQDEAKKWLDQGIPEEVLYVKNIIATFGDLLEDGYKNIVVQPTHMFYMEQSYDLSQYVNAIRSIQTVKERWRPFGKIALGRPALGTVGDRYDYHKDMQAVLKTLAADADMAKKQDALLVYMAHGNEHWSTGIYHEAAKKMREMYPKVVTCIGVVEGFPGIDDINRYLSDFDRGKIILKPLMIVAGDHAINDMAGDEKDSWKSILTKAGFEVTPKLEGLGSNDEFARIFVDRIRDAAKDSGISLKAVN